MRFHLAAAREQAAGSAPAIVTGSIDVHILGDDADARVSSVFDDVRSRLQAKKK
jgi:hypothetical protein